MKNLTEKLKLSYINIKLIFMEVKMLKSKKPLLVLFLAIALLFLFPGVKTASAQNGKFIVSALPIVPGFKIVNEYGIIVVSNYLLANDEWSNTRYSVINTSQGSGVTAEAEKHAPDGANGCVDFKVGAFRDHYATGWSCEYVKLLPIKK
jgi:hypothetical protein